MNTANKQISMHTDETALKPDPLLKVTGLYKKFCKDLTYNMYYGIKDLITYFFGLKPNYSCSGKTTLTRMLAGIYDTERGTIEYHKKIKKIISVFAIKSGFNPILTGRENIYLKAAYYGMSRAETEANMDFIISFSDIAPYLDTPIGKYSSGMKTRLAMAIVLSIKSDILFIDEGFSFSDAKFKAKCYTFLKEEYSKKGRALIIATHRLTEMSDLANRLIVLEKGKIINTTVDVAKGIKEYMA